MCTQINIFQRQATSWGDSISVVSPRWIVFRHLHIIQSLCIVSGSTTRKQMCSPGTKEYIRLLARGYSRRERACFAYILHACHTGAVSSVAWKSLISQAAAAPFPFGRVKSRQFIVHIDMPFCPPPFLIYNSHPVWCVIHIQVCLYVLHFISASSHPLFSLARSPAPPARAHKVRSIRALKKRSVVCVEKHFDRASGA